MAKVVLPNPGGPSKNDWKGTFFCELVETNKAGKQVAKMEARIWRQELTSIRREFRHAGLDLQLENGTQVALDYTSDK